MASALAQHSAAIVRDRGALEDPDSQKLVQMNYAKPLKSLGNVLDVSAGAGQSVVAFSVEGEGEALRGFGDSAPELGRVPQLHGEVRGQSEVALRRDRGRRGRLRRGGGGGGGGGDSGVAGHCGILS